MAPNKRNSLAPAAIDLRKSGKSWTEIGKALGINGTTAHMAVDPVYAARRRQRINYRRRDLSQTAPAGVPRAGDARVTEAEAEAAIASVPADTRGYTARVMGDPLPGRSALDKRGPTA